MGSDWAGTEQRLIRQLKDGDQSALGDLMDHYGEDLMRYVYSILGCKEAAEDAFQDTWLRLMENVDEFKTGNDLAPWLFRIARNRAYDMLRRSRGRWVSFDERVGSDEDPLVAPAFAARCHDAATVDRLLPQLEPAYREILFWRFFEEKSYDDIAAISRLPMGTVKSRLKRALDRLASLYRDSRGGESS